MSVAGRSTVEVKSKIKTKRILIVDDEPDIAFALKTILEEDELFQVDTFHDAESALSTLLDIRMPGMNGFQLCRKLRQIDKKLKICFLTATELLYYRKTDSDIIDDLGTDCFVTKPVNNKDIIDRLQSILM
jgi:DNA-binding response OmpR family regulator